jgi:hypothetical protein
MSSSIASSPLSSLSSVPSDDEIIPPLMLNGANHVSDSEASSSDVEDDTSKPKREVSPPHELVLADNPDIAVSSSARRTRLESRVCAAIVRVVQVSVLTSTFLSIQFIVMFRARFSDAFPQKLIHFGPQDLERGVVDSTPSSQVEQLLCAILALVLNRKKPIE